MKQSINTIYSKVIALIMIVSMTFSFSSCAEEDIAVKLETCEEYVELVDAVDEIIGSFSLDDIDSGVIREFYKANDSKKAEMALEMADDIARANFIGLSGEDILGVAGSLVKAYPHPLLLNNFATMTLEEFGSEEALYFFSLAAAQEPENPVILTNLANVYMDLDNFEEAKRYAGMALSASNDYGPAYQVLTTVHLKNDNSMLAAETMIKSAKYCFNDISVYHFNSFLEAASQLDPKEDEYPLKEAFIEDLYTIAKENTGSFSDMSTDTPDSQLTLKPFPQITGADNLMKSADYFEQLLEDLYNKEMEINEYYGSYESAADNALSDVEYSFEPSAEGRFPVQTDLRQIYSIKVLDSFYTFKLKQLYEKNKEKIDKLNEDMWNEIQQMEQGYDEKEEQLREKAEEYSDLGLAEILEAPLNESSSSDLGKAEFKKAVEATLAIYQARVERQDAILKKIKNNSNGLVNICQAYYNEQKQLLEEYWLKYGGLLKYIKDEDLYMDMSGERENRIYEFIANPLYPVTDTANTLVSYKEMLDYAQADLVRFKSNFQDTLQNDDPVGDDLDSNNKDNNDPQNADFVPEIEREAITEFSESSDMGSWGVELSEPIFGIASVSASYDGETLELEFNSILGGKKGSYNLSDGSSYTHKVIGATATGDTKWFTDRKAVSEALNHAGATGKGTQKLGKIGFSYSDSTQSGSYTERSGANIITDVGTVHIRETGGGVGKLGRSEKITVKKSLINGVAIKSKTTKYKFWFGTFEH